MVQRWPEPFVTGAGFEPFIYPLSQRAKKLNAGCGGIRVESSLSEYLRRKGRKGRDEKHRRKGKAREERASLKGNGQQ